MNVPFFKQSEINESFKRRFFQNALQLFDGTTSLVNGNFTRNFEQNFSQYVGSEYFAYVSNGLDALILALEALNIKAGDEVVVPSHTYIATWLAPLRLGCKLIVAPVHDDNFLLDISRLPYYLSEDTKVIMPVHLYGNSCDINALISLKKEFNFSIVEDAAQAHGSILDGKVIGSIGDLTCFSFYPTKNLGALGEAGGVSTNDWKLHEKIISLRNYGRSLSNGAINQYCGLNRRGDELQAAFLVEKLKKLDSIIAKRQNLIAVYKEELSSLPGVFHLLDYQLKSSPHLSIIQLHEAADRDALKDYLLQCGVHTSIHYAIPCHQQPFYNEDLSIGQIPYEVSSQAETIASTILSLPMSEVHSVDEVKYVCSSIKKFFLN